MITDDSVTAALELPTTDVDEDDVDAPNELLVPSVVVAPVIVLTDGTKCLLVDTDVAVPSVLSDDVWLIEDSGGVLSEENVVTDDESSVLSEDGSLPEVEVAPSELAEDKDDVCWGELDVVNEIPLLDAAVLVLVVAPGDDDTVLELMVLVCETPLLIIDSTSKATTQRPLFGVSILPKNPMCRCPTADKSA